MTQQSVLVGNDLDLVEDIDGLMCCDTCFRALVALLRLTTLSHISLDW